MNTPIQDIIDTTEANLTTLQVPTRLQLSSSLATTTTNTTIYNSKLIVISTFRGRHTDPYDFRRRQRSTPTPLCQMGFLKGGSRGSGSQEPPAVTYTMVDESLVRKAPEWKPNAHELMIMITLSVISFMVALDACIIVTSLSVRNSSITPSHNLNLTLYLRLLYKISAEMPPRASGLAQPICSHMASQCLSSPPSATSSVVQSS